MNTRNERHTNELNYRVITPKGDIPIKDINPGDLVYNYITGEPMEVQEVRTKIGDYARVIYSDGRSMINLKDELFMDGFESMQFGMFKYLKERDGLGGLFIREYDFINVLDNLTDPSLVGALYVYGNWDMKYANLPITSVRAQELYGNCYVFIQNKTVCSDGIIEPYVEFGNQKLNSILHHNLFGEILSNKFKMGFFDFLYKEYKYELKNTEKRNIPRKYMFTSLKNRNLFLSGVFDIGKFYFNDNGEIVLYCNNQYVVNEIQKMLYSLGIVSTSLYSQNKSRFFGYDYEITLRKMRCGIPNFIYNVHDIRSIMKEQDTRAYESIPVFKVKPSIIKEYDKPIISYNLKFDKPNQVFLTSNFLPKVSYF